MTILQRSTFSGTAHQDVRPGAYTKTATVEGIVKDQAYLYERITGLAVPDAGSAAATGHDHSGDGDGALIRIPLAQGFCAISLPRRSTVPLSASGNDSSDFVPVLQIPVFAPIGITQVRLVVWATPQTAQSLLASSYSSSLVPLGFSQFAGARPSWLSEGSDTDLVPIDFYPLNVNQGLVNIIQLKAWDGLYDQSSRNAVVSSTADADFPLLPDGRMISSWEILPITRSPNQEIQAYQRPTLTSSALSLPSTFTSFDSALIADDVGLSGYHLVSINQNDGVLQELATNKPAGAEASATIVGHNHAGGSTISACGEDIDHCLGAWFYGNVKPAAREGSGSSAWGDEDCIIVASGTAPNIWTGGVSSYVLTSSSGSSYHQIAEHKIRVPAAISANLADITGKINASALVYYAGKTTNMTVRVSIGDADGTNYGATKTITTSTTGKSVLSFSGIQMTSNSATSSGDHLASVKIELRQDSGADSNAHLLGFCLYYEA